MAWASRCWSPTPWRPGGAPSGGCASDARAAIVFWPLLRVAQATVVVQALLGFLLLARGASAPDGLHVAYGIAPLVVTVVTEGMRAASRSASSRASRTWTRSTASSRSRLRERVALGEMGVMTVGSAADPHAGAAGVPDGRLGRRGQRREPRLSARARGPAPRPPGARAGARRHVVVAVLVLGSVARGRVPCGGASESRRHGSARRVGLGCRAWHGPNCSPRLPEARVPEPEHHAEQAEAGISTVR